MFFYHFLLTIHVIACLLMILVVLLQTGRGAGLNVFGGGGDSLVTTPTGSSFMKNFTLGLSCLFGFTSLFLTLLSGRSGMSSVTGRVQQQAPMSAPQAPPAPPPPPASAPAQQPSK